MREGGKSVGDTELKQTGMSADLGTATAEIPALGERFVPQLGDWAPRACAHSLHLGLAPVLSAFCDLPGFLWPFFPSFLELLCFCCSWRFLGNAAAFVCFLSRSRGEEEGRRGGEWVPWWSRRVIPCAVVTCPSASAWLSASAAKPPVRQESGSATLARGRLS